MTSKGVSKTKTEDPLGMLLLTDSRSKKCEYLSKILRNHCFTF